MFFLGFLSETAGGSRKIFEEVMMFLNYIATDIKWYYFVQSIEKSLQIDVTVLK